MKQFLGEMIDLVFVHHPRGMQTFVNDGGNKRGWFTAGGKIPAFPDFRIDGYSGFAIKRKQATDMGFVAVCF